MLQSQHDVQPRYRAKAEVFLRSARRIYSSDLGRPYFLLVYVMITDLLVISPIKAHRFTTFTNLVAACISDVTLHARISASRVLFSSCCMR